MLDYREFRIVHSEIRGGLVDGHEYRDRIVGELGDMANSGGTQGAPGGSFAFTESDIRKVVDNWMGIADSYARSLDKINDATAIDGPGLDYASDSFANTANLSGKALSQHLVTGREYCLDQAQLAQNALDDYLGVEHTNVREIAKTQQAPHPGI